MYCSSAAVFFGFSVGVILRDAFRKKVIVADQIFAGVNGFLIAGLAWGNLYLLVHLMSPESFAISDTSANAIENVELRRFEFNHLSFATLAGIGYGDVTPIGRLVPTLLWMESAFGMFYLAVIVGMLVGLKMASSITGSNDDAPTQVS
jgi:hypothetical protein